MSKTSLTRRKNGTIHTNHWLHYMLYFNNSPTLGRRVKEIKVISSNKYLIYLHKYPLMSADKERSGRLSSGIMFRFPVAHLTAPHQATYNPPGTLARLFILT